MPRALPPPGSPFACIPVDQVFGRSGSIVLSEASVLSNSCGLAASGLPVPWLSSLPHDVVMGQPEPNANSNGTELEDARRSLALSPAQVFTGVHQASQSPSGQDTGLSSRLVDDVVMTQPDMESEPEDNGGFPAHSLVDALNSAFNASLSASEEDLVLDNPTSTTSSDGLSILLFEDDQVLHGAVDALHSSGGGQSDMGTGFFFL